MLNFFRRIIPSPLFKLGQPIYHFSFALIGALIYAFPSRKLKIVGITGTKGKTSTVEFVNAILEEAGLKTAIASTLRFKIGNESLPNLHKMTMPGRFFMQKFLNDAKNANCDWAIIEMTSEGVKQYRHKFIDLDALIFTNISPEHIESHGSFENYLKAKLELGHSLEQSKKRPRTIIANKDDDHGRDFLALKVENKYPFFLEQAKPYSATDTGTSFTFEGEPISSPMLGLFNISNMLAAATFASAFGISPSIIAAGLERLKQIRGRVEFVTLSGDGRGRDGKQKIDVVVDYAHTPDSLEKLYLTFPRHRKICVLGNTGGGRDKWKRPEMGSIADKYCDEIILTNEDPYDENPIEIISDMKKGVVNKPLETILDRRDAIRQALIKAKSIEQETKESVAVLITGKGTDPFIMGPKGTKMKWDDAQVAREELGKLKD